MFPGFHIHEGVMVRVPGKRTAEVLSPFYVKVQLTEDGFVATSDILDVYELGETVGQGATNYLYSLVDELIWFQEHKESLSTPMLKDLAKLHHHLGLV